MMVMMILMLLPAAGAEGLCERRTVLMFLKTPENPVKTEAQLYNLDSPSQFKVSYLFLPARNLQKQFSLYRNGL